MGTQNQPTPSLFLIRPALTSLPSVSKTSKSSVIRYCVGATSCQMQFLLGGYSLGQPGLVMEPFSLVMKPPQAAGERGGETGERGERGERERREGREERERERGEGRDRKERGEGREVI